MADDLRISVPTGKTPPCLKELLSFVAKTKEGSVKTSFFTGILIQQALDQTDKEKKFPYNFGPFKYAMHDEGGFAITVNFQSAESKSAFSEWAKPVGQAVWCCKLLRIQIEKSIAEHKLNFEPWSEDWIALRNFLLAKRKDLKRRKQDFVRPVIDDFKRLFDIELSGGEGKKSKKKN